MHHPNGTWLALPWGLPIQKLVALPFPIQHHHHHNPYQAALSASTAAPTPLITLHHHAAGSPTAQQALPTAAALQTFLPTATFTLQPQTLTALRQVSVVA